MSPLADAWERVEAAINATPHAYEVRVFPALPPVVPYRVWVEITYRPPTKKRNRTDRIAGEGLTLAEALNGVADGLASWAPA